MSCLPSMPRPRGRALRFLVAATGMLVLAGAGASTAAAACENEQLRIEMGWGDLPDCRGYEMVSPAYHEGFTVYLHNKTELTRPARDVSGNKVILQSFAVLAGTPGSGENTVQGQLYLATRGESGWQAAPLSPPSSIFSAVEPLGQEPVDGMTLWEAHKPDEPGSKIGLWSGSQTDGYSFIGLLDPPYEGEPQEPANGMNLKVQHITRALVATSDYGHIVLRGGDSEGDHWPFDGTQENVDTLYEYSGTGNEHPVLVAVTGPKGSTELVGVCGSELGGGSTYNALSRSGEAIFFTVKSHEPENSECSPSVRSPSTEEVYARLHGAVTSPQAAETVDISESECTGGGPECEHESAKEFEGASEDGTRAFFTSTQKLTSDAIDGTESGSAVHKGGCNSIEPEAAGCNLYEYNFARAPGSRLRALAAGHVRGVAGIAEDGGRVYFVSTATLASAGEGPYHAAPVAGQSNLYAYETESADLHFIATLGSGDRADWSPGAPQRNELAGPDGEYLVFTSTKPKLTPDDTTGLEQIYEYDALTNELVRITQGEDGFAADGNAVGVGVAGEVLGGGGDVSEDGRTVAFETAGQLSPRAIASDSDCTSVYEFHSAGPRLSEGRVHLISDGRDSVYISEHCGATLKGISATGADIFFDTEASLVPEDTDGGKLSLYDARADGGFAPLPLCAGVCPAPFTAPSGVSVRPAAVAQASSSAAGSSSKTLARRSQNPSCRSRARRADRRCHQSRSRHGRARKAMTLRRRKK